MIKTDNLPIRQEVEAYVFAYPEAAEFARRQRAILWTPEEIDPSLDKQDFLVEMSEAERHAIKTILKLFTMYEVLLNEAWGSKIYNWFPRPETQMMASTFAFMESSVHAVFYSNLNKALLIDNEEFYLSYKNDPVLSDRIKFVNEAIASDDIMLSIAAFTLLENVVLYSNFAFIKHYQNNGKNLLKNVVSGINFSAKDEQIHAEGAAWLFKETLGEYVDSVSDSKVLNKELHELQNNIYDLANKVRDHEYRIIEMLFENGDIEGIDESDLRTFIDSRINMTLNNLGLEEAFEISENPIAIWFYDSVGRVQMNDFFQVQGSEYSRTKGFDNIDFSEGF